MVAAGGRILAAAGSDGDGDETAQYQKYQTETAQYQKYQTARTRSPDSRSGSTAAQPLRTAASVVVSETKGNEGGIAEADQAPSSIRRQKCRNNSGVWL